MVQYWIYISGGMLVIIMMIYVQKGEKNFSSAMVAHGFSYRT